MAVLTLKDGQADLPSRESTQSYWHREPSEKLLGHRSTADLPPTADVVVVGSGITGSFAARELVQGGRDVLLLEAREACWGATGRNGGHCQPFVFAAKPHIAAFELATYAFLKDLVETHRIPCDWRSVGGVATLPSQDVVDTVARHLAELRRSHPDLAAKATLYTRPDDLARLRVGPGASGAVLQPHAARCWPYKLVAWVLETLLRDHADAARFNLQTNTPVTGLQRAGRSWIVHTPRGQVAAPAVLLATNAYTSHLLPALTDLVVPVRGQVCALTPPPRSVPLDHSHVWNTDGNDDYLVQPDSGDLILGGERFAAPDGQVGISHDDVVDPDIGRRLRRALHSAVRLRPGEGEDEDETLEATYEWTGIMGYSKDIYPWVGRVPESLGGGDGLWLSGGYTGHGMPVAARCAVAVADDILGRESSVHVPHEYRIDEGRPQRARAMALPNGFLEELKMMIGP